MLGVLLLLVLLFGLTSDHFPTALTLATIANQVPALTVVAVGMTFVLGVAGIDLPGGWVLALGAVGLGVAVAASGGRSAVRPAPAANSPAR